jgi:hypothetical protein
MSSPFTGFNNAILKIPISSGNITYNSLTGNYEEEVVYEDYSVILMVKNTPINIYTQGVDDTEIECRGYLVDPMIFPNSFALPAIVDCVFFDIDNRQTMGTLELKVVPDPFKVGVIAGQKIEGIFKVTGPGNSKY